MTVSTLSIPTALTSLATVVAGGGKIPERRLEEIQNAVTPTGIRGLDRLVSGSPQERVGALLEIAQHPGLGELFRDPEAILAGLPPIDTSDVAEQMRQWGETHPQTPPLTGPDRRHPLYDPSTLAAMAAPLTLAFPMACHGSVLEVVAAALPSLIAGAMTLYGHRANQRAIEAVLGAVGEGRLPLEALNDFRAWKNPPPSSAPSSLIDDIARSGSPGPRSLSPASAAQMMNDLFSMGGVATAALQTDPSGHLYDQVVPAMTTAVMMASKWRPHVLHGERLQQLVDLQKEGTRVIIVTNHRSYVDILACYAIFGDLSPRMVAKKELSYFLPVVGLTATHHPLAPWRWIDDGCLKGAGHVLINRGRPQEAQRIMLADGLKALRKGHALFVYAEGTRAATPVRSPERVEETGMRPFKGGIFHLATHAVAEGERVVVVPVSFYGHGGILPRDLRQIRDGLMLYQPQATLIGEPIQVNANTDPRVLRAWAQMAMLQGLGPLQAFFNEQQTAI